MPTFNLTYPIHTYEADANGRAPFGAIFRFLQDIAAVHAIKIGYGLDDLRENANMWVLSLSLSRQEDSPLAGGTGYRDLAVGNRASVRAARLGSA